MMPTQIIAIGLGGLGYATLDGLGSLDEFEVVAGTDIADEPRERFIDEFDAPAYESIGRRAVDAQRLIDDARDSEHVVARRRSFAATRCGFRRIVHIRT